MDYTHLLDTNIVSDLVKNPTGEIYRQISEIGEERICTSIVVACELRYGAQKSGSSRLRRQMERILERLAVVPVEPPVNEHYAVIRTELERLGTPIGPNDLLIAAHATTLNLTLVTAYEREFRRVPGLTVENWL